MQGNPEEIELIMNAKEAIMTSINQDEPYTAINEFSLLLNYLDNEFKKEHKLEKIQKKIDNFLKNQNNNRILRLNQRIKMEMETAIEYYDADIGNDERLFYNQELEKDILELQYEIKQAIATIIKNKIIGEISFD